MTKAYIIDTETTGLVEPMEPISFAYKAVHSDLRTLDTTVGRVVAATDGLTVEQFFKPSKLIEWGAMATHGILMSDLEGYPPAASCKLPADCTHLIGHNIDYDWKVLGKPNVKRICTLAMARSAWPTLDSHTLSALMYYTKGATPATRELLKSAHGAAVDVGLVAVLLPTLLDEFQVSTIEALWTASEEARIPKIMSFGKYKGQPIRNVDGGWVAWYRRQEDTDEYLLKAFKLAGK
jgi:exodeoxyribonuclease X